jgi:hypothetical protein
MTPEQQFEHVDTKLSIHLGDARGLWADASDKVRLEIIKSVIWTAPDMEEFSRKVLHLLESRSFRESLD